CGVAGPAVPELEVAGGEVGAQELNVIGRDAAGAAEQAEAIHGALDPIAQSRRTTAVLTTDGETIAAGSGGGLTPAQRDLARQLDPGMVSSTERGAHAEIAALREAERMGLDPQAIGTSRAICDDCAQAIRGSGGTVIGPNTAIWR